VSAICAAAISPSAGPAASSASLDTLPPNPGTLPASPEFQNLKVLPKDVSSKKLQGIMVDEFEDGLGVGCGFCHSEQKGSHRLDYASDAKPEKAIARAMMRMTQQMNRKYFLVRHPAIGDPSLVITCGTCHHGQPHPDNAAADLQ
jgi:hypothetical protein